MPITPSNPFKGRHYSGEVVLLAVRWYLRYPLAYEHVAEMLAERGLAVDASCVWRWVQAYAPELEKCCRPPLRPTNKSYRIDETYIRIKGQDRYLYRAVDSTGQTIEFLLTAKRDAAAAKRFLLKSIEASGNAMLRVMTHDPRLRLSRDRGAGPNRDDSGWLRCSRHPGKRCPPTAPRPANPNAFAAAPTAAVQWFEPGSDGLSIPANKSQSSYLNSVSPGWRNEASRSGTGSFGRLHSRRCW